MHEAEEGYQTKLDAEANNREPPQELREAAARNPHSLRPASPSTAGSMKVGQVSGADGPLPIRHGVSGFMAKSSRRVSPCK